MKSALLNTVLSAGVGSKKSKRIDSMMLSYIFSLQNDLVAIIRPKIALMFSCNNSSTLFTRCFLGSLFPVFFIFASCSPFFDSSSNLATHRTNHLLILKRQFRHLLDAVLVLLAVLVRRSQPKSTSGLTSNPPSSLFCKGSRASFTPARCT